MKIESARIMGNDLILTASIPDARRFVYGFKPGEYEISPAKKKRSLNANAYAWKLINDIALAVRESPEDVYREALKNIPNICEVLADMAEENAELRAKYDGLVAGVKALKNKIREEEKRHAGGRKSGRSGAGNI